MKKECFTLEDHKKLGIELIEIRYRLLDIIEKTGKFYPKDVFSKVCTILGKVDDLRSDMENIMFSENPEIKNKEGFNVYYGESNKVELLPNHDI